MKHKKVTGEISLFSDDEFENSQKRPEDELIEAYVNAIGIVDDLDDITARVLLEEMSLVEHKGQMMYYLKNLPGCFLNPN